MRMVLQLCSGLDIRLNFFDVPLIMFELISGLVLKMPWRRSRRRRLKWRNWSLEGSLAIMTSTFWTRPALTTSTPMSSWRMMRKCRNLPGRDQDWLLRMTFRPLDLWTMIATTLLPRLVLLRTFLILMVWVVDLDLKNPHYFNHLSMSQTCLFLSLMMNILNLLLWNWTLPLVNLRWAPYWMRLSLHKNLLQPTLWSTRRLHSRLHNLCLHLWPLTRSQLHTMNRCMWRILKVVVVELISKRPCLCLALLASDHLLVPMAPMLLLVVPTHLLVPQHLSHLSTMSWISSRIKPWWWWI